MNERDFPFIIELPGASKRYQEINQWLRAHMLEAPRGTSGTGERFCFLSLMCAEAFREKFGGELVPARARKSK